ncbi:MAG: dCMP deaminase family protein [archaeon]|jgi:dCMP deaminase
MQRNGSLSRPSWDEYFMLSAVIAATRSSCTKFHSGTVIVKNKRIIASGYNGPAPGIESGFDLGYCRKEKAGVDWTSKGTGHCLATHAEANAIIQNHEKNLNGAKMYSLHFPCNECAKLIASSGISEVVYLKMYKEEVPMAQEIFNMANVTFRKLEFNFDDELINKIKSVIDSAVE